jgi:hypothetical protein
MWRANDVLVGIITGAIVAIVAALMEFWLVAVRFMSLGQHGGGFGSGLGLILIVGAIVGGIIGLLLGAVIKPRTTTTR